MMNTEPPATPDAGPTEAERAIIEALQKKVDQRRAMMRRESGAPPSLTPLTGPRVPPRGPPANDPTRAEPQRAPARGPGGARSPSSSPCRKAEYKALLEHCARAGYSAPEAAIMGVLWAHVGNEEGEADAYPSSSTIARLARCTDRCVRKALKSLMESGEVWTARANGGALQIGGRTVPRGRNVYLVVRFASAPTLQAWAEAGRDGRAHIDGAGLSAHLSGVASASPSDRAPKRARVR